MKLEIFRRNIIYFVILSSLLILILSFFYFSTAKKRRSEFLLQVRRSGMELLETFIQSARNALLTSSIVDELLADRLMTSARLIDLLNLKEEEKLAEIAHLNDLEEVDILDMNGNIVLSSKGRKYLPFEKEKVREILRGERERGAFLLEEENLLAVALRKRDGKGVIVT